MPRPAVEDNNRLSLRIRAADKAAILRASALAGTGLSEFILRTAVAAARDVIERHERITLSERDSLRVLALLEDPPSPNARLRAAARALPPLP